VGASIDRGTRVICASIVIITVNPRVFTSSFGITTFFSASIVIITVNFFVDTASVVVATVIGTFIVIFAVNRSVSYTVRGIAIPGYTVVIVVILEWYSNTANFRVTRVNCTRIRIVAVYR